MAFVHMRDGSAKIRKYGVTGTATKTVVTIEIEISDPYALASIMSNIEEAKADLAAALISTDAGPAAPKKKADRPAKKPRVAAIERQSPLALTYRDD